MPTISNRSRLSISYKNWNFKNPKSNPSKNFTSYYRNSN